MKMRLFIGVLLWVSFNAGFTSLATATVVLDMSFEHLARDADGLAADGQLCVDSGGNGYHGFFAGGSGAEVVTGAAAGTTAIDTSDNDIYVILRDDRTFAGHGEPGIVDPVTTPTPYWVFEAEKSYTFEAVLQWDPASTDNRHGIMGAIGSVEVWIREDDGFLEFVFDDGPTRINSGNIDISALETDGQWHHLALVLDRSSSEIRAYTDYQLIYTDTNPAIAALGEIAVPDTQDWRLGAYNANADNRFDGRIDHIVISSQALGPDTFVLSEHVTVNAVAVNPAPENHAIGIDPGVILEWDTNLAESFTYDVYFGTDPQHLSRLVASQTATSFDPSGPAELDWNTRYYWRIDVRDDDRVNEGLVWDFTTIKPVCHPPLAGDYNGDCVVDMTDLILLMANWLEEK